MWHSPAMSLNTLLEAAKYLEMQEQQQQQQRTLTLGAALTRVAQQQQQQQQLTSNLGGALVVATAPTPLTTPSFPLGLVTPKINGFKVQMTSPLPPPPPPTVATSQPITNLLYTGNGIDFGGSVGAASNPSSRRIQSHTTLNTVVGSMMARAGIREVHNELEKNRRAHLKECFDVLKKQLPLGGVGADRKFSNLSILHAALRCIDGLKRRERHLQTERDRLAGERSAAQRRLLELRGDGFEVDVDVDVDSLVTVDNDNQLEIIESESPPPLDDATCYSSSSGSMRSNSTSSESDGGGGGSNSSTESYQATPPLRPPPLPPNLGVIYSTTMSTAGQNGQIQAIIPMSGTTTAPPTYPVVLQKVISVPAAVGTPKTVDLPLVASATTAHLLNGTKMVVNAQYVMKPVVVVSRPS